jgi:hypothetical protein
MDGAEKLLSISQYVLIAFHVCLKENAVPICPGTDLS